ncbi:uncharacterized protein LOC110384222 [Helicoverpa armigera]|uniref:uncharacterized protein LOC124637186 n=1 Tax=Helicoverpa zea TaxID=7113 RepID=UPI000B36DB6E|nr:uncharacterized protein LOC124637186 [Helicoverpa zea]XP_049702206.1 uncharacterized protein LOC110384222 [Helicoverpa armigera]PZC85162.1 hypothetical protein B5X24_HaOG202347 [Helicoverpa armigera]
MLKHTQRPPAANDADHRYQNMPRRPHHHLPLNVSTLDSSKHSVGGTSASVSPGAQPATTTAPVSVVAPIPVASPPKLANGNATGVPPPRPAAVRNRSTRAATEEALTSLALLCLVSLLLALLALLFLLKISAPATSAPEEFAVVYEVTLALCALTLSLNLCCLLVCAIQFLFAVKLVHSPSAPNGRSNKYLQKSAITRVCAVGGFFISIPVFLTGIILYTFIQFHSTPAIVTSVFIGVGIIFCGCAMVHNVFVWQKEKTNLVKAFRTQELNTTTTSPNLNTSNGVIIGNGHLNNTGMGNLSFHSMTAGGAYTHPITLLQQGGPYIIRPPTSTPPGEGAATPGVPAATIDLSHDTHELSTLV